MSCAVQSVTLKLKQCTVFYGMATLCHFQDQAFCLPNQTINKLV